MGKRKVEGINSIENTVKGRHRQEVKGLVAVKETRNDGRADESTGWLVDEARTEMEGI